MKTIAALVWASAALAAAADIQVEPSGSLLEARDAARRAEKPVRIVLDDGVYRIDEPLALGPEDSGVSWEARHPGKATISGGRRVTGWRQEADGVWSASVPWVSDRSSGFRQLVVDGVRRPRARLPKKGYFTIVNDDLPAGTRYNVRRPCFFYDPAEFNAGWEGLDEAEIVTFSFWTDHHLRVKSVDAVSNKVFFVRSSSKAFDTGWTNNKTGGVRGLYLVENIPAALTEPGEWRLETKTRTVFYRPLPGEDPNKAEVVVPFVKHLVELSSEPWSTGRAVENVAFRGIRFADSWFELSDRNVNGPQGASSTPAAIALTGARRCLFEDCSFENLSAYAVRICDGTRECAFSRCRVACAGAGGFRLDGGGLGDHPGRIVTENVIADCDIGPYGLDFRSGVGVLLQSAERTKIVHNDIHDGFYSGVSSGWTWGYLPNVCRENVIGWNRIRNIGQGLLSDMGGIYLLGPQYGTRVVGNVVSDISARAYGGWGLYCDEGSQGIVFEDNVVWGAKHSCFNIHYSRDILVRNNIFAGGGKAQIARTRREDHISAMFYGNIVYWERGELYGGNFNDDKPYKYKKKPLKGGTAEKTETFRCDRNLYWNPTLTPTKAVFPGGRDFAAWKKSGKDAHSRWGDPLFEDAERHDYRLKPGSPAFALGFRQIDVGAAGPRRR